MGWTKRQIISQAFDEIGLAGYVFDLSPEQLNSALLKLDAMMAQWDAKNIRLGYPLAASPQNSDIDTETDVPLQSVEAIYTNLAMRIAASFGKAVSIETKQFAKIAYDTLLASAAFPRQQQMPGTMPAGAGNKPWRDRDNPFLRQPDDNPLAVDGNGQLDFVGD